MANKQLSLHFHYAALLLLIIRRRCRSCAICINQTAPESDWAITCIIRFVNAANGLRACMHGVAFVRTVCAFIFANLKLCPEKKCLTRVSVAKRERDTEKKRQTTFHVVFIITRVRKRNG